MHPQNFTLKNGLRVILIDTKAFPTMTTILLIGAGSRYENEKNNGVAHFFEHMAFKGSKKYPNFFIISSILEGMGAYHNAFTSKDHTGYWVKAPTVHFEKIIDVLSDMVLNPLLKQEEIEKERNVIVEEMNMREDNPQGRVGEYFEELLYKGNPLGFDVIGSKETVAGFKRQTFVDYMNSLYNPKNAVLVVAGGLADADKARYRVSHFNRNTPSKIIGSLKSSKQVSSLYNYYFKIIEKKFANWSRVGTTLGSPFQKVVERQNKPQLFIKYKKTEQTHFILGFRTFSFFDPRRYALAVLTTILGGGASSKLFIEVREKRGLCYYIYSGRELYQDVGYISSQAGVTNNLDKIKEAITTIMVEHKKLAKGELNKSDLSRAKEILKGRTLLSMEDSSNIASFYGTKQLLENKIEGVGEVIKKIEAVKGDEVVDLAKEIFRAERLNFALIGPFEEENFKNIINF